MLGENVTHKKHLLFMELVFWWSKNIINKTNEINN